MREQIADLPGMTVVIEELETADGAFRDRLRRSRFDTLEADRSAKLAQLHELGTTAIAEPEQAVDLLDAVPIVERINLTDAPEAVQRKFYDALQPTIRYDRPDQARFRLVVTVGTLPNLPSAAHAEPGTPNGHDGHAILPAPTGPEQEVFKISAVFVATSVVTEIL